MIYLIAYDITKDSLRNRVHKYLSGWGRRVQKSVFECELNRDELKQVASHLHKSIKEETDRCHIYKLCAECMSFKDVIGNDIEPDWGDTVVV